MTTVRYFIPEDGDTETHPNVFLAPKSRQHGAPPTLGQIKHSFPLPGKYHFRFKSPLTPGGDREGKTMAVWMDVTDDRQMVPVWRQSVVAKVTRLSPEEDDDDDDDIPSGTASYSAPMATARAPPPRAAPAPAPVPPAPAPAPAAQPMLDIFDGGSHGGSHSAPPSSHPSSVNLLDVPAVQAGGSLLDMDAPAQGGYSSAANDFLGMTASAPPPAAPAQHHPYPTQNGGMHPQQQQQQRPPAATNGAPNAFDQYSNQQGPFGGLAWK